MKVKIKRLKKACKKLKSYGGEISSKGTTVSYTDGIFMVESNGRYMVSVDVDAGSPEYGLIDGKQSWLRMGLHACCALIEGIVDRMSQVLHKLELERLEPVKQLSTEQIALLSMFLYSIAEAGDKDAAKWIDAEINSVQEHLPYIDANSRYAAGMDIFIDQQFTATGKSYYLSFHGDRQLILGHMGKWCFKYEWSDKYKRCGEHIGSFTWKQHCSE